jgi:hypothetical protein
MTQTSPPIGASPSATAPPPTVTPPAADTPPPAATAPPKDKEDRSTLETVKLCIDMVQGLATIVAILAGGYWFFLQRSISPQVKIEQTVTHRPVQGEPGYMLMTVDVRATNVGKVKVDLQPGEFELRQVNPTLSGDDNKPLVAFVLKSMTLEPGESDQALFKTIEVPVEIKTVQVHSDYAVPNETKKFWNLLSAVDVSENSVRTETATSVH